MRWRSFGSASLVAAGLAAGLAGCNAGLDREALLFVISNGTRGEPVRVSRGPESRSLPAARPAGPAVTEGCAPIRGRSAPGPLCLALRYVVYRDSYGAPVETEKEAASNIDAVNRIWRECGIQFQVDRYEAVVPSEHRLRYRTAEYGELEEIRRRFRTEKELLVVTTGDWDRSGSLGMSWANAWTNLPGEPNLGAILESSVSGHANVLAHELGHYLSLDHASDSRDLMSPVIFPGSVRLSREQCDSARWAARAFWKRMLR